MNNLTDGVLYKYQLKYDVNILNKSDYQKHFTRPLYLHQITSIILIYLIHLM